MARVLVIDDDAGLLQMVKLMLEREGHTAILAEGGEEGLQAAQTQAPDVAIIDLMMPGISGYDVTRQLRSNASTARIPVMILTARSQPMDKQMAINAGATTFMSKPVSSRELTARIAEILSGRSSLSSSAGPTIRPLSGDSSGVSGGMAPPTTQIQSIDHRSDRRVPIGAEQSPLPSATASKSSPIRKLERQLPITAVLALRPGTGATTISINLAFLMRRLVERVCILDFALANGQVGLYLHLPIRTSWADLIPLGERFEPRAVGATITPHPQQGIGVVGAPSSPQPASLTSEAAVNLLNILTNGFQQIVVDVNAINPASVAALALARTVIVVVGDDMATAQNTNSLPRMLSAYNVDMAKVRVVVNHHRPEPGVPIQSIAKALGANVTLELPYDVNQLQALRRGTPTVVLAPESAFALAIQQLIRLL
jgi:CheY-like chemotaxis protein